MSKSSERSKAAKSKLNFLIEFPSGLESALGPKPVLPFEDPQLYEDLQMQVIEAIQPKDALEFIDVRNFLDLTWSIIRIRRYMIAYEREKQWENIFNKLAVEFESKWLKEQKAGFVNGDKETLKQLSECLAELSSSITEIELLTFSQLSQKIQFLELLLAQLEARRTLLLRELEKRRDNLARRLREETTVIEAKLVAQAVDPASTSRDDHSSPSEVA